MSLKKMSLIFALLFCTSNLMAEDDAEIKEVTLTNGEWKPYLSESLKEYGPISYWVKKAFEKVDIKVTFKFNPWKRAYKRAKKGKADGSIVWSWNDDRDKDFFFADPLLKTSTYFIHKKGSKFDWNELEDIQKFSVLAFRGYAYGEDFEKKRREKKLGEFTIVGKEVQGLKMILKEKVDVTMMAIPIARANINDNFEKEEREQFAWHEKAINTADYSLIVNKKDEKRSKKILELFNKGLKMLVEEKGEKWVHSPCKEDPKDAKTLTDDEKEIISSACPKIEGF